MSAAAKGQIVFGYFALSAIASPWSGRLTERYGPSALLRLGTAIAAASSLGAALAPSFVTLLLAISFGGLANAFAQPAANALIVILIQPERRGFALGIKQAAIPLATMVAGLAVPILALTVGWRWAFVMGATLATGALTAVPSRSKIQAADRPPPRAMVPSLSLRPLVMLAVGVGLGSAMANSLGAFTTSSAVEAGISAGAAGALLAIGSAVGLTLRVVAGWMADRRDGRHLVAVAAMLCGGAVGLSMMASGQPSFVVLGTLIAFGAGWTWPGVFNLAVVSHHVDTPAAATGVTQAGAYTGGALGPLTMGLIVQQWGYGVAWLFFAIVALVSAMVMLQSRVQLLRSKQERLAATP